MDLSIFTPQNLVITLAFIFLLYEVYDKISKIIARVNAEHDRVKKWDEMEDKLLKNIQEERDKIYANYDKQLAEIRQDIDENHADTEAKVQQLTSMMILMMKSVNAILEREIKQGANGDVQKMHEELTNFLYEELGK